MAQIQTTSVWIVEWLSPDNRKTGKLLHDWIQERRPGWSAYSPCKSKAGVFGAIERATIRAQQSKMIPVLHIEAHGDEVGLEGPDGTGGSALITWDELTDPLQRLNLMTGCNLIVFVAACTGFAAIQTFRRGPLAPAAALVGPDGRVTEANLLSGTKEFYRRWTDEHPNLDDIVASVSLETEPVVFGLESFAILAFEALAESLIISMRPSEQHRCMERIRRGMRASNKFSEIEIERKLSVLSPFSPVSCPPQLLQHEWDKLFMIDLYPANRERFGVDMAAIVENVLRHQGRRLLTDAHDANDPA
jgi:hypothetical protein